MEVSWLAVVSRPRHKTGPSSPAVEQQLEEVEVEVAWLVEPYQMVQTHLFLVLWSAQVPVHPVVDQLFWVHFYLDPCS